MVVDRTAVSPPRPPDRISSRGAMSRYDDLDGYLPRADDSDGGRTSWDQPGRGRPGRRSPQPAGPQPSRPRPVKRKRRSPVAIGLACLAVVVAVSCVGGAVFAYAKYRQVWDGIKRINVSADLKGPRPHEDPNALNLLVIGSDSRAGKNGKIGGHVDISGQRSDTVMVLHIAPGGHQITVLNIPRDSVVPILNCTAEPGFAGQQANPGQVEQINSTFAYGGPGCLWKTIEQTTHIRLNDFIEMTFTGFEHVIDDLGGVEVCLPEAVDVPQANLKLKAGMHHIWGYVALGFWRAREGLGLGSDLQRIQRDQFLLASVMQGIEKSGLLHNYGKILKIVTDLSSHHFITTDTGLTPNVMLKIAEGLRGLTTKHVRFIEVPTVAATVNPTAWVQWTPQDQGLFAAIANDTKLPKAHKSTKKGTKGSAPVSLTINQARVEVMNGSGVNGIAATAATTLSSDGFHVTGNENAPGNNFSYTNSVIKYASPASLAVARQIAALMTNVTLQQDSSLGSSRIDVILGSTFTKFKTAPTSQSTMNNLTKQYGGVSANVNICHDQAAFAS
jgi:LCP family protein required for cell wall assembly